MWHAPFPRARHVGRSSPSARGSGRHGCRGFTSATNDLRSRCRSPLSAAVAIEWPRNPRTPALPPSIFLVLWPRQRECEPAVFSLWCFTEVWVGGLPWVPWLLWVGREGPQHPSIVYPKSLEEPKKPGSVGLPGLQIYQKKSGQRTRAVSCAATRTSCHGTLARRLCRRTASRAAATPATTPRTKSTGSVSWSASSVTDAT